MSARISLIAVVVLAASCGYEAAPSARIENHCDDQSDCAPTGSTCDLEMRMCVAAESHSLLVGLEIALPQHDANDTAPLAFFAPEPVSPSVARDLTLPDTVNVIGTVRQGDDPTAIPAELIFTALPPFEGAPSLRAIAPSLPNGYVTMSGARAEYGVNLLPGVVYDTEVQPSGESLGRLPPLRFSTVDIPDERTFMLPIRYPETLEVLRGKLVSNSGGEVKGLVVQAIDRRTLRVVSSTTRVAESDDLGAFTLYLLPGTTSYLLRVSAPGAATLAPTFTVDPAYLYPEPVIQVPVPAVPAAVRYVGTVEGMTTEGMGPVAGAVLTFRSNNLVSAEGVVGTFQTTVTTDEAGLFDAQMLPGTYNVTITPRDQPNLGVLVDEVLIDAPTHTNPSLIGQLFTLPGRAVYGGRLSTPDGRPMEGVRVEARARGQSGSTPAARFNRSSSTLTDATGQFNLRLDVGTYDVVIHSPDGSGFPWIVERDVQIGAPQVTLQASFAFRAPVPLRGTATSASGEPVAGVMVTAYGIVVSGEGTRSIPIATAVTNAEGRYVLALPPSF